MQNTNSLLFFFGVSILIGLTLIVTVSGVTPDIGCHVIGTEINGDYSTEYLTIGNC